jgi:hypothetical protein
LIEQTARRTLRRNNIFVLRLVGLVRALFIDPLECTFHIFVGYFGLRLDCMLYFITRPHCRSITIFMTVSCECFTSTLYATRLEYFFGLVLDCRSPRPFLQPSFVPLFCSFILRLFCASHILALSRRFSQHRKAYSNCRSLIEFVFLQYILSLNNTRNVNQTVLRKSHRKGGGNM